MGHFPPSSKVTGVRNFAAAVATIFPTFGLPVKKTRAMKLDKLRGVKDECLL
jgi:hypothetical protein